MNTENPYICQFDVNIERLMREKKWARVVIVFASIGIFAGLSAAIMFYFRYHLVLITILALISGILDFNTLSLSDCLKSSVYIIYSISCNCWLCCLYSCAILTRCLADMDL